MLIAGAAVSELSVSEAPAPFPCPIVEIIYGADAVCSCEAPAEMPVHAGCRFNYLLMQGLRFNAGGSETKNAGADTVTHAPAVGRYRGSRPRIFRGR